MTENLDDVFNNIFESEQESKAQQEYLEDLKNKISTCEKELADVQRNCVTLQEGISKKMKHLSRREVMLKTLEFRHQLLQERVHELKSEKDALNKSLGEMKQELKKMRKEFCAKAKKFDEEYGFSRKPTKSFSDAELSNFEQEANQEILPVPSKLGSVEMKELHSDLQNFEGIEALLFDVNFNSSQIN